MVKNTALVFLKPDAVTDKSKREVSRFFRSKKLRITTEGSIPAETINKNKLLDKHYHAIASKATLLKPVSLDIPKDEFWEFFGVEFNTMLEEGKVLNAQDARDKLDLDDAGLNKLWVAAEKNNEMIKFGADLFCALIKPTGGDPLYTFNGFYLGMRSKFVAPGTEIYYYIVEFDSADLSWADFRGKVVGPADPADAPKDSLRGIFWSHWKKFDLKFKPNADDNAIHASASPFESLVERMNWLGCCPERDAFGKQLLTVISEAQIREWALDPQVSYGNVPATKSLFEALKDTNRDNCLALCKLIASRERIEPDDGEQKAKRHKKDNTKQWCNVSGCTKRIVRKVTKRDAFGRAGPRCMKHGGRVARCNVRRCRNYRVGKVATANEKGPSEYRCRKHGAVLPLCNVKDCGKLKFGKIAEADEYGPPGPRCMRHNAVCRRCNVEECSNYKWCKISAGDDLGLAGYRCRRHSSSSKTVNDNAAE
eukprot:GEMP01024167.1.p1 GENE.GEMP01024167.1~~GEMP01024167.1.p1  ORF type:complete len:480 (-),score=111.08 GEMP01024167.1:948-2387(-)